MRFGVVVFPGTWSDGDCYHALKHVLHQDVDYLWYRECPELASQYDCVILPGGFSYGDYLRPGAIARFAPIMAAVEDFAARGGLVVGICNGFQVLCESGLLPGVLMKNRHLQYRCQWAHLRVETDSNPFTSGLPPGQVLRIPISHGEGNYFADASTIADLEQRQQVLFRYSTQEGHVSADANPNGSTGNIAGVVNRSGNVLGMMPHPERCCEALMGGTDGARLFGSLISNLKPA